MNLTPDQIFYGIATVCSIIAAILSQRAAAWGKAATMTGRFLNKILGKPDEGHARPSTGVTVTQKIESLDDNQVAFIQNQLLIAKTLRMIADDLSAIRGTGKRRLPTDAIEIPKGLSDGPGFRDGDPYSSEEGMVGH